MQMVAKVIPALAGLVFLLVGLNCMFDPVAGAVRITLLGPFILMGNILFNDPHYSPQIFE
jgi:hypothetical protein